MDNETVFARNEQSSPQHYPFFQQAKVDEDRRQ
jgi:hypothetical protein